MKSASQAGVSASGSAQIGGPIREPHTREYTFENLGAWGGIVNVFVKEGNIGYLGAGQRFVVLDMTDPANLQEIAAINLGGVVQDFKIRDGLAYVGTDGYEGYSDTSLPDLNIADPGPAASSFHVIDVTDPAAPQLIWSNPSDDNTFTRFYSTFEVDLYGDIALVNPGWHSLLEYLNCVDLTDPRNPVLDQTLTSAIRFRDENDRALRFHSIEIKGDYVFGLSSEATQQFQVFDLSSIVPGEYPITLHTAAQLDFGVDRDPKEIVIDGNWAYVNLVDMFQQDTDPLGEVIWAIDISDPLNPVKHGSYAGFGFLSQDTPTPVHHISASNGRLYATSGALGPTPPQWDETSGLVILDIATDPGQPTLLGTHRTHGSVRGVMADGTTAYLMDLGEGLIVADASDPNAVDELGGYYSPAEIGQTIRHGDLLYSVNVWNGLDILDVSDLSRPTLVGVYQTPGRLGRRASGLDLIDDIVYLAAGHAGLQMIDVSNPANPTMISSIGFPVDNWHTAGIAVEDQPATNTRIALLSVFTGTVYQLFSIDVTDPAAPTQRDTTPPVTGRIDKLVSYAPGRYYATESPGKPRTVNTTDALDIRVADLPGFDAIADTPSLAYNAASGEIYVVAERVTGLGDLYVVDTHTGEITGSSPFVGDGEIAIHPLGVIGHGPTHEPLFRCLDMSDPDNPVDIATGVLPTDRHRPMRISVSGNSVFVSWHQQSLKRYAPGLQTMILRNVADMDGDGAVTALDVAGFLQAFQARSLRADIDGNNRINFFDLTAFLDLFAKSQG